MLSKLLALAAATTSGLIGYAALKLLIPFLRQWSSPLHQLKGPKDKGSFFFGNFPDVDSGRARDWIEEYGKVIKLRGLFWQTFLLTVDTRALNHVMMHSMDYQKAQTAREVLSRSVGPGLLVAEGEHHRLQRRILNPAFSPMTIRALTTIFYQKATQLCGLISSDISSTPRASQINVIAYLNKATLDIIGLAGFGYKFNALNNEKKENELNKAFSVLFNPNGSVRFFRILELAFPFARCLNPTSQARKTDEAQATMRRIGIELLNERKSSNYVQNVEKNKDLPELEVNGRDLLSILVKANTDPNLGESKRLTDEDVLGQVPTFFVAGHETTSTQTTWCLFELAKNPEIQSRLRDELLQVPTNAPTMDELNELPYLENVVRETLRFHPAVPKTSRVAMHDDVLPLNEPFVDAQGKVQTEIRVKKGDRVFIPIRIMNRLKEIWGEDADEFKPERWLDIPESAKDVPGVWGNMMTFLGGARSCIGYRFALVEMKVLLFTLLRSFEFELAVPTEAIVPHSAIVTRPYLKDSLKSGSQMPLMVKHYKVNQ